MAFQDDLYMSENSRQSDKKAAGSNQSAVTTAEIAHYRRVLTACLKWGVSPSDTISVLHELGAL